MVDEIKFDKISMPLQPKKISTEDKKPAAYLTQPEEITVTNNLSSLVNSMISEDKGSEEIMRVKAMRQRIQTNNYQVDVDALAKKLFHQVFSKTIGT